VDPKNRCVINVLGEEEVNYSNYPHIIFGNKLLVYHNHCDLDNREHIKIWRMGNPPILLKERIKFKNRDLEILKVDKQFIVARQFDDFDDFDDSDDDVSEFDTLHFICPETLEKRHSLILMPDCKFEYNRGLLFQSHVKGIVRILDVASGTHFSDVRLPFRKEVEGSVQLLDTWASSNSKCIVMGWKYSTKFGTCSHLSVYDLEAVKKPNSDPSSHLLYTLQFQFDMEDFVMNESEIAFMGNDGKKNRSLIVLKFVNFNFDERKSSDLKENPEVNEGIKMKIILGPYVDCVPCQ